MERNQILWYGIQDNNIIPVIISDISKQMSVSIRLQPHGRTYDKIRWISRKKYPSLLFQQMAIFSLTKNVIKKDTVKKLKKKKKNSSKEKNNI